MTDKNEVFVIKASTIWNAMIFLTFALVLVNVFMTNNLYSLIATGGTVAAGTQQNAPSAPTSPSVPTSPSAPSAPSAPNAATAVDIDVSGSPTKGSAEATVTVVEFSDYQCPFCARFWSQTLPSIQSEYIDTGKIKFVYMDFPLNSLHPFAQKAAEGAECAGDQDKYWEYHDVLFSKQSEWASIGVSKLKEYASDLGLDTAKFNNCLDSGEKTDAVNADLQVGLNSGVRGTPGFLVNEKPILSGACPFSAFKTAIEAELNGQDWAESNCNVQIIS